MNKTLIAYIPVLHQGYVNLLKSLPSGSAVLLFSEEQLHAHRSLEKDLRAVQPSKMIRVLTLLFPELHFALLDQDAISTIMENDETILTPLDEVMTPFVVSLFPNKKIETISTFLRWDKNRSQSRVEVSDYERITSDTFDQHMMALAQKEADKSSDWWRQVGCVLLSPERHLLLSARNRHLPQDPQHYTDGDPRADFQSGENIDTTTSIHAEAQLIALAAKLGVRTENCSLYVTTFPCPNCAKLIAEAGVTTVFFDEGYSLLDAQKILHAKKIKVVKVISKS